MRQLIITIIFVSLLSGCALTPEPCTRDFFSYQADFLKRDFEKRNRGEMRRLRILRNDLQTQPDLFTALALVSAKRDLETIVDDVRIRVVPKARSIAQRCGIDSAFDTIMDGFLLEQGVDPTLVRTLGLLEYLEDPVLRSTLEP